LKELAKHWLLATLGGVVLGASLDAGAQTSIYSCTDKNGRRLTADRPIPECIDREQRVLDRTGTERRRIGPTLTDNERAALEAQRRTEAEQRERVVEQRRRERALVNRFPNEATHHAERNAALGPVNDLVLLANKRIDQLRSEREEINTELEFYHNDPKKAPARLQRRISENESEIAEQRRFIAQQEEEKQRIRQRYEAELVQLKALWAADRAARQSAAEPASGKH